MTIWPRAAAAALCLVVTLIGCRQPETPQGISGNKSAPPADSAGNGNAAPNEPEFIPSPNNLLRVRHMVLAVTAFTLFHELGHMIVHEYKVPQVGKPEDIADRFATFIMTPQPKPAGAPPDTFDPATDPQSPPVMWAAWWWHELWTRKQKGGELPDYASRHGLDISRAVEVMCLTYGLDPKRFEQPFRRFLSKDNHDECIVDAHRNQAGWQQVLERPIGGNWWMYEGRVAYNPAPPALAAARTLLMEEKMLEMFASRAINELPVPPHAVPKGDYPVLSRIEPYRLPIDLVADACPKPDGKVDFNAYWEPAERRIRLCYGFVALIEALSRETIARTEIGQNEKMPPR